MTPHSSTLAWRIPWIEEPGRLQSMGSQRVDSATNTFFPIGSEASQPRDYRRHPCVVYCMRAAQGSPGTPGSFVPLEWARSLRGPGGEAPAGH